MVAETHVGQALLGAEPGGSAEAEPSVAGLAVNGGLAGAERGVVAAVVRGREAVGAEALVLKKRRRR